MIDREQIEKLLERAEKHRESGDSVAAWRCYVEMIETLREILKGGIQTKLEMVK